MANIFDLSRDDFFFTLNELGLAPEQRDELIRQYRSQNSIFGALNRAAEVRQGEIAGEGRRPVAGGLLSKPKGATGMDALRGLRLEPMSGLLGMLTGVGRAIDAPAAAAQGLIPEGDMVGEALGTAGLASLGGAALTRPVGSVGMGGRVAGGLPEPRNAAERAAREILDMRAAGRAGEVTNEMMARADPQYMFDNTPLPMDEASRMARAAEMGFDLEPYLRHGSKRDFPGFQVGAEQSTDYGWYGQGVSLAPNDPGISDAYAMVEKEGVGEWGGRVYPVTSRGRMYQWPEENPPALNREQSIEITQSLRDLGYEGANIYAPNDFDTWGDAAGAWRERVIYDPSNIRSRFARFDPEFAHLSNLNAANASPLLGLLAMMAAEEQRNGR